MLILEDGTGLPTANSYADGTFAEAHLLRDPKKVDWLLIPEASQDNLLILASEMLDLQFNWFGTKTVMESGLRFPRTGVYTRDGALIGPNTIPINLKKATCELAYFMNTNDALPGMAGAGISRIRVDVIDIRFDATTSTHPFPPLVLNLASEFGSLSKSRRVNQVYSV